VTVEENKALVRRYFDEVLDGGNTELVQELFTPDCITHFPHPSEPRVGSAALAAGLAQGRQRIERNITHIDQLIAEGDLVAVQLRHDVTYRSDVSTRVGSFPTNGKTVSWGAHVFFRIRDGKIAEEWVLLQLGALPGSDRPK
jgi:predicted ester cyclase